MSIRYEILIDFPFVLFCLWKYSQFTGRRVSGVLQLLIMYSIECIAEQRRKKKRRPRDNDEWEKTWQTIVCLWYTTAYYIYTNTSLFHHPNGLSPSSYIMYIKPMLKHIFVMLFFFIQFFSLPSGSPIIWMSL